MIRASRTVLPPPLPKNPDGKVLLNLGSGHTTHPSFINIDALVAWHIHYIRPIDNLRPIADGSVDLVYASHCLEHFSHRRLNAVLTEWRRVLKPGGVLRLGVPDFDQLVALYEYAGRDVRVIQGYLMGDQNYFLNSHYTAFTRDELTARLKAAGFSEVRLWHRGCDEISSLPDCTGIVHEYAGRKFPISLNLEAVK
jgi:predicted SAM-dependent methyltransferase